MNDKIDTPYERKKLPCPLCGVVMLKKNIHKHMSRPVCFKMREKKKEAAEANIPNDTEEVEFVVDESEEEVPQVAASSSAVESAGREDEITTLKKMVIEMNTKIEELEKRPPTVIHINNLNVNILNILKDKKPLSDEMLKVNPTPQMITIGPEAFSNSLIENIKDSIICSDKSRRKFYYQIDGQGDVFVEDINLAQLGNKTILMNGADILECVEKARGKLSPEAFQYVGKNIMAYDEGVFMARNGNSGSDLHRNIVNSAITKIPTTYVPRAKRRLRGGAP